MALFAFLGTWGDYFGPLIYLRSMDKRTIALAMNSFVTEVGGGSDYGGQMAFCALAVLPVIVLFFFAQRTFIEGIALTGIKG